VVQSRQPRTRTTGLRIGRVAGVPILLMPSWFLFAGYLVLAGRGLLSDDVGSTRAYLLSAGFAVLLLVSVVAHEVGHCLVARAFDLPVKSITVSLLAGLTEITEPPQTPAREYAVAICGPMVSILLCGVGVAAADLFPVDSSAQVMCVNLAITNGAIAALNLLPGLPLDGGRVLKSAVWQVVKDADRATRISARAGMGIGLGLVPLVLVGVLPAVGVGDRGITTVVVSALVGTFIYVGASASLRRAKVATALPGVTVARLARAALGVAPTTPLAEAVRQAHEAKLRAIVVVDGNGRVEGVVSEAWVRQVPMERRPWVVVADGARKVEPGLVLDPSLSGDDLLERMRATPASEYLVKGPQPQVLVSADVAAAMQP
jgi:Zn-dependent protease